MLASVNETFTKYYMTGDADGLGEIRKNELLESGVQLGVKSREDIVVVDDPYVLVEDSKYCEKEEFG